MNKKERINLIRELESELAYGRFVHTLNVALNLLNLGGDRDMIIAGLLHFPVRDYLADAPDKAEIPEEVFKR